MTKHYTPILLTILSIVFAISCKKNEGDPPAIPPSFCRSVGIGQWFPGTISPAQQVLNYDEDDRIIGYGYIDSYGRYRKTRSYSYDKSGQLVCPEFLSCTYGNNVLLSMTWPYDWSSATFNSKGQLIRGAVANVDVGKECTYVYNSDGDPIKIEVKYFRPPGLQRTETINLEYLSVLSSLPDRQPEFSYLGFDAYWSLYDGIPVPSKHLVKKWAKVGPDANGIVKTDNREFSYKFDSEGRITEAKNSTYPDMPITFVHGKCQ